ncbi:unnamed protein product [Parnassius mnemosyne]|uniref:Uncharacterized protein n=1 Tax=Parnassius mnemosyne TaxID=213953 RepID=A0AAV1L9N1_9NEOP
MLKSIWMSRLPHQVQGILVAQKQASLEDLGDLADKLHETNPQLTSAYKVSAIDQSLGTALSVPSTSDEIKMLHQKVDELTRIVASLTVGTGKNKRYQSRSRSRSQSRTRDKQLCWYHNRFSSKAHRCVQPCSWQAPNGPNQGNSSSNQ